MMFLKNIRRKVIKIQLFSIIIINSKVKKTDIIKTDTFDFSDEKTDEHENFINKKTDKKKNLCLWIPKVR